MTTGGYEGMRTDEVAKATPTFDFRAYFDGHTRASGWFADRFGRPRRHFCGDFVGMQDGADFLLDETLRYTDGVVETRLWHVRIDGDGAFRAEGDALLGPAVGRLCGNALRMRYRMRVATSGGTSPVFDFDDLMLLQPDGSLHNLTQVRKWGLRLGTVSTQYVRHDGSAGCGARSTSLARGRCPSGSGESLRASPGSRTASSSRAEAS